MKLKANVDRYELSGKAESEHNGVLEVGKVELSAEEKSYRFA